MAKRKTAEETIVEFFQTADLVKVETVYNIVRGIMRSRQPKKPGAAKKSANADLLRGSNE